MVLDKEEDPNFIMTLSIPIYGFPLQNLCFVYLRTLQAKRLPVSLNVPGLFSDLSWENRKRSDA